MLVSVPVPSAGSLQCYGCDRYSHECTANVSCTAQEVCGQAVCEYHSRVCSLLTVISPDISNRDFVLLLLKCVDRTSPNNYRPNSKCFSKKIGKLVKPVTAPCYVVFLFFFSPKPLTTAYLQERLTLSHNPQVK